MEMFKRESKTLSWCINTAMFLLGFFLFIYSIEGPLPVISAFTIVLLLPLGLLIRKLFGTRLEFFGRPSFLNSIYALYFGSCLGYALIQNQIETAKERGDVLMEAVAEYKASQGTYPVDLESLVPGFVESLPNHGIGLSGRREFYLHFKPETNRVKIEFYGGLGKLYSRTPNGEWLSEYIFSDADPV